MAAMKLHHSLVTALVCIMNDCDSLLADGVPSAVNPGDQYEAARDALPLHGHLK